MPDSLLPDKPVLLLGASGKLGLEIRKAMQIELPNRKMICCSRQKYTGHQFPNETWVEFDPFQSKWDFGGPLAVVINAIGAIAASKAIPFSKIHGELTALMLQNRAAMGEPRILQISAIGASAQHTVEFLRTKGEADEMLKAAPNAVVLKPSIVCTPGTMLSQKFKKLLSMSRISLGKLLVPEGFLETQIQPIMGADLGRGIVRLIDAIDPPKVIDLVGPARLGFGEILELMANPRSSESKGRNLKMITLPREFMDGFVKYFLSVWFPGTINYDQFQLLFQDNIGDARQLSMILGQEPAQTDDFWEAEAKGNAKKSNS